MLSHASDSVKKRWLTYCLEPLNITYRGSSLFRRRWRETRMWNTV